MPHKVLNGFKTAMLLGLLSAMLLLVGQWLGGTTGLVIAGVFALAMNGGAYFFSDKLALRAMHAREVSAAEAPRLHAIVAELAQRRNMPMPRVYVSPTMAPNAFATAATRPMPRCAARRASCTCSMSGSYAACWGMRSATSATATSSSPPSPPGWPA